MNGNAFRIMLEHEKGHATGPGTAGKFDFWVVKNKDFKPKKLTQVTSTTEDPTEMDSNIESLHQIEKDSNITESSIKIGQCYRFEALNEARNYMLFSRNDSAMYSKVEGGLRDSTFKAVSGQDNTIPEGISFISTSVPDRFLRHWGEDKVSLHAMDTVNIEKDSTFKVKSSLVSFNGIQIEASN